MSLEGTDYLIDLLQELDGEGRYICLHAVHPDGTTTYLGDLGDAAYEMMAQIIDVAGSVTLHMRTPLPDAHRVSLKLRSNDDTGLWDVTMEAGSKTDELNISDILGKLKEIYS